MKKAPFIALAILILLVGAYFSTRKEVVKKITTPYSIEAVAGIERAEISKPDGELIILEKLEGKWVITKPIQVPVSEFHAKKINETFGKKIAMDDLVLSKEKLADYNLSKENAYKVSLFTKSAPAPSLEFYVGKESAVSSGARRSFIKTLEGVPYRAKSEIAAVVRSPLHNLRTKLIFASKETPDSISIVPREGTSVEFTQNEEDGWKMASPIKENFKMDNIQIHQLVGAFRKISADGFGDGLTDKEMDLDPPRAVVSAKFSDRTVTYEVGNPAKKVYYIRIAGEKRASKVTKGPGRVLAGDYLIFKDRVEKTVAMEDIVSFQLAGKEKLNIVRKGTKWFAGKNELDRTKIAPLLGTFAKIRAVKWQNEEAEASGLNPPEGKVILRTKDANFTFEIGKIFKKDNSRYARWSDSEYVMEVPYYIWDRASYGLETLKLKEKK